MTDDLRALAVRVRRLVPHSPFDHDFVRDEKKCPLCKTLAEFDFAFDPLKGREEKS